MKAFSNRSAITKVQAAVIAIIIVVAVIAGVYYVTLPPAPTPTPTPTPTPKPSPTPIKAQEPDPDPDKLLALPIGSTELTAPFVPPWPRDFKGVTITIVCHAGWMAECPKHWYKVWEGQTGGRVEIVEIPIADLYDKVMTDLLTGAGKFHIMQVPNDWIGDLATGGFILELDKYREMFPEHFEGLLPHIREKCMKWGGKTYFVANDGDTMYLCYRKDALEDPEWKAKFKTQFGYEYHVPPRSWEEVLDIAKFFNGWSWTRDGRTGYGFVMSYKRAGLSPWYYVSFLAQYLKSSKYPGSVWFNPETMEPLCNTPGAIEAFRMVHELTKYGPPGVTAYAFSENVMSFITEEPGPIVMSLNWADTPITHVDPAVSKVIGKVGFGMVPGAEKYWDLDKGEWVHEFRQTAVLPFGGWSLAVSKYTPEKAVLAAVDFVCFLSSKEVSTHDVWEPRKTGSNPYRTVHVDEKYIPFFVKCGWPEEAAREFMKATMDTYENPSVVWDLRIPGFFRLFDTLDAHISAVAEGTETPEQAATTLYGEWTDVIGILGKVKCLAAYRQDMGLPP